MKNDLAAECAMKALRAREAGDRAAAARLLDAAVRAGGQGWVYALRGAMRAEWDDLQGARSDLDRSLRLEDSTETRLARARVARRLGRLPFALAELGKVAEAAPSSPEPHVTAAAIHFDQARFREALACLDAAARRAPGRADILAQRARVRLVLNDLPGAEKDLSRALRAAPRDSELVERLAQVLILDGRSASAERLLGRPGLRDGARELWQGYILCRRRRYAAAAGLFAAAEQKSRDEDRRRTARFYRWVARLLALSSKSSTDRGLSVVGLGYRQPYQVCAASLKALADADLIYANISDPGVGDFLGLFGAPRRMTYFRNSKDQAESSAREVFGSFSKARRAAVVTRGHPTVFGPLALSLVRGAAKRGVPCRVLAAPTTFDHLPTLVDRKISGARGLQVRDATDLLDVSPRLPLIVYRPHTRKARGLGKLIAGYQRKQPCYLLPGQGERHRLIEVTAGRLRAGLKEAGHSCTLFIPAARD